MDDFATSWAALDPAPRRALELAYESLVAGGLPVGSVLFVLGVAAAGASHPTVAGNPEAARIALDLLPAPAGGTLGDLIGPVWPRVSDVQLGL